MAQVDELIRELSECESMTAAQCSQVYSNLGMELPDHGHLGALDNAFQLLGPVIGAAEDVGIYSVGTAWATNLTFGFKGKILRSYHRSLAVAICIAVLMWHDEKQKGNNAGAGE